MTAEVQHLIGRAGRADFDGVEDSLETMHDMNIERQQLAHLMSDEGNDDDDDFINSLQLAIPEEGAHKPAEPTNHTVASLPSPPAYLSNPEPEEELNPEPPQPLSSF